MKPPTAAEKRHWTRIAALGCLVCERPAEVHHVVGYADRAGRISKRHDRVTPLCPTHHREMGGLRRSVHDLGHRGFFRVHGIDLLAEADRLWAESEAIEQRRKAA